MSTRRNIGVFPIALLSVSTWNCGVDQLLYWTWSFIQQTRIQFAVGPVQNLGLQVSARRPVECHLLFVKCHH